MIQLFMSRSGSSVIVPLRFPASQSAIAEVSCQLDEASREEKTQIVEIKSVIANLPSYLSGLDPDSRTQLAQLNQLSSIIAKMDSRERDIYAGALDGNSINDLNDMIRVAEQVSDYILIPNVNSDVTLGRYVAVAGQIQGDPRFPEAAWPYLDFAKIGAEYYAEHGGAYTYAGYVLRKQNDELIREKKSKIQLDLTSSQAQTSVCLPATKEELERIKRTLGVDCFAEAVITEVSFSVPYMDEHIPTTGVCVEDANELAWAIEEMQFEDKDLKKYLSVLSAEQPETFQEALYYAMNLDDYIHFTDEQKQRAAEVDLEEFLRRRGEKLLSSGRDKRLDSDHSVTIRGCEWFDHDSQQGGNAISFVRWFYHCSYPDAVKALLGDEQGAIYPSAAGREKPLQKPFELPEPNSNMRRVFAYLMKQRHIDRDVIAYFAKAKTLFEDSKYHNCVFVGTDEQGIPRHAHKRSANSLGKSFRQNVEGSDPRYSFHHIGTDGKLYVFEAPIDMLSFITMYPDDWKSHNYVACCGTSAIPVMSMLSRMPCTQEVFLCLDNDAAGQAASLRMAEQIAEQFGIASDRLAPQNKDWNDDLCVLEDAQVPFLEMG